MCRNLFILIKENYKLYLRQCMVSSILFLLLIPCIYGISNLNSVKAADCLGKMVSLIGIPLLVPIAGPEQDSDIRNIMTIKSFPYRGIILLRLVIAVISLTVLTYTFELYLLYKGGDFPIGIYTLRTVITGILPAGFGLLISLLSRSTIAGLLPAFCCHFIFSDYLVAIILSGVF